MDELTLDGEIYISSKKAAKITGYSKDYVGQMCREGRVDARTVGRNWYIKESSIRAHRFGAEEKSKNTGIAPAKSEWESTKYSSESTVFPQFSSSNVSAATTTAQTVGNIVAPTYTYTPEPLNEISIESVSENSAPISTVSEPTRVPEEEVIAETPVISPKTTTREEAESVVKEMHSVWKDWFDQKRVPAATIQEDSMLESPKSNDTFAPAPVLREEAQENSYESEEEAVPLNIIRPQAPVSSVVEEESTPIRLERVESIIDTLPLPATRHDEGTLPIAITRSKTPEIIAPPSYTAPERNNSFAETHIDTQWKSKLDRIAEYSPAAMNHSASRTMAQRKPSLVLRALLIAVMVISIAVAFIGSGYADRFLFKQGPQYTLIQYLGGEVLVHTVSK